MNNKQNFDIKVEQIVPEYYSKNKSIKRIFFKRFEKALALLKENKINSILDIGCGDGIFTNILKNKENYKEVVGVDYNKNIESLNKVYKNIKFIRADLYKLNLDKKFDAVTCLDVLEHFENVNIVLNRIDSVLRTGGYLVVSGPTENFLYKLGRLITKGTFSQETGPGAGKHYHNIKQLDKIFQKRYKLLKKSKIRFMFIHLFDINLYKKL